MKSLLSRTIQVLAVAMLLAGCSEVTTRHPLSEDSYPVAQDQLEGIWLGEGSILAILFPDEGNPQFASIMWESDELQIVQGELIFTQGKSENLVSARLKEDGKWSDEYLFVAYTIADNGNVTVLVPDPGPFETAIQEERLKGTVKKDTYSSTVRILDDPGPLLDFLNDESVPDKFDRDMPFLLHRVIPPKEDEATVDEAAP